MLALNDWDLLQPVAAMQSAEFEIFRARLGGYSEICKTYPLSALRLSKDSPHGDREMELLMRVRCALNVYLVQGAGLGELMFAGAVRKGLTEHKLLLTVLSNRLVNPFRYLIYYNSKTQ